MRRASLTFCQAHDRLIFAALQQTALRADISVESNSIQSKI